MDEIGLMLYQRRDKSRLYNAVYLKKDTRNLWMKLALCYIGDAINRVSTMLFILKKVTIDWLDKNDLLRFRDAINRVSTILSI